MPLSTSNRFDDREFVNFDSALQFDGVDDRIITPINNDYRIDLTEGFAFSVFIKPERFNFLGDDLYPLINSSFTRPWSMGNCIFPLTNGINSLRTSVQRTGNNTYRLQYALINGTNFTIIAIDKNQSFNTWSHYFFWSKSGVAAKAYLNGKIEATLILPQNFTINEEIVLGSSILPENEQSAFSHYAGQIRDLCFFNIPDSSIITDAIVQKFERGSLVPEELHPYCFAHFPLDKIELR